MRRMLLHRGICLLSCWYYYHCCRCWMWRREVDLTKARHRNRVWVCWSVERRWDSRCGRWDRRGRILQCTFAFCYCCCYCWMMLILDWRRLCLILVSFCLCFYYLHVLFYLYLLVENFVCCGVRSKHYHHDHAVSPRELLFDPSRLPKTSTSSLKYLHGNHGDHHHHHHHHHYSIK